MLKLTIPCPGPPWGPAYLSHEFVFLVRGHIVTEAQATELQESNEIGDLVRSNS